MKTTFKKFLPHPILSVALLFTWLLLNNTIAAGHIVLGSILAILIPWFSQNFWQEKVCVQNPLVFVKFFAVFLFDVIVANLNVAKQILSPNDRLNPQIFHLPLDIEHPLGISFLASTISLTPGTVSCDLSEDRSYLVIHALSLEDAALEIETIKNRYEKPLMEVFKRC